MKKICLSLLVFAQVFSACAQQNKTEIGTIEFVSPELSRIIKKDVKIGLLPMQIDLADLSLVKEKEVNE